MIQCDVVFLPTDNKERKTIRTAFSAVPREGETVVIGLDESHGYEDTHYTVHQVIHLAQLSKESAQASSLRIVVREA